MKTLSSFFLLLVPFFVVAQGDDNYCPCGEKGRLEKNQLMDIVNLLTGEAPPTIPKFVKVSQPKVYVPSTPSQPPVVLVKEVPVKEEPEPVMQTPKTEPEPEPLADPEPMAEPEPIIATRSNSGRASTIKRSKRRFSVRVKSRKRVRKYRGGCPRF
ncbi:MAG: hypothetical protein AAFU03_16480 [Bacteroidota bacterium]